MNFKIKLGDRDEISLDFLKHHIPRWGGKSDFADKIKNATEKFYFINTCTIDYYLFAMWLSAQVSPNILVNLSKQASTERLLEIINEIDKNNWNRAKTLWLFDFCKRDKSGICNDHNTVHLNSICTFGTEYTHFYRHVSFLQSFNTVEKCNTCKIDLSRNNVSEYLYLIRSEDKLILYIQESDYCYKCNSIIEKKINFVNNDPCWLICEIDTHLELTYDVLPKIIFFNNINYKLLCCTFNVENNHFRSIFYINKKCYLIDDMNAHYVSIITGEMKNKIVTCFYYK